MSFFIYPHKFDACHVHFGPATQNQNNTETTDSKFYRTIYSTNNISLNSMGFVMHFIPTKMDQSIYRNKWLVSYDISHPTNINIISQLRKIECGIIDKFMHSVLGESRKCIYSLSEHLNSGCIKAYSHYNSDNDYSSDHGHGAIDDEITDACDSCGGNSNSFQLVVTIFGVWETRTECGIVYKFIKW